MRLGVFGGSFDPVHWGHLQLAAAAQRQLDLHRVLLIPAACQPLKPHGPRASDADRLAMLRLAIEGRPGLAVDALEIDRGGVSYTYQTLEALRARTPEAELFLVVGADSVVDLPRWRKVRRVLELATPLIAGRPGHPLADLAPLHGLATPERLEAAAAARLEMPPVPISSSDIRRRIAAGQPWRALTPPAVGDYIERRRLYRGSLTPPG